jgi:hypothetical protein
MASGSFFGSARSKLLGALTVPASSDASPSERSWGSLPK